MNKTAIKNFAIWARNKLRADIILKAGLLGITDKEIANPLPQSTNDLQIFDIGTSQPVRLEGKTAIDQRKSLVAAIRAKNLKHAEAFDAVIEEVYTAMITMQSWMFLSSFEQLRKKLLLYSTISMAHLGARAFDQISGEIVQTTCYVNKKQRIENYLTTYKRLTEQNSENAKRDAFLTKKYEYHTISDSFQRIPSSPIAYWVSESFIRTFENPLISSIAFSDGQILTGDNNKYLRFLWEVDRKGIENRSRWVLHAKGGGQRRWYGNIDTVVSWTQKSIDHYKKDRISRFPKDSILFRKGITWSLVSSSDMFSMRMLTEDTTFNKAAATILFYDDTLINYVLAFLNTKITREMLTTFNPTLNTNIKDILALPIIFTSNEALNDKIERLTIENINISKADWDSFETSWDFKRHPLI